VAYGYQALPRSSAETYAQSLRRLDREAWARVERQHRCAHLRVEDDVLEATSTCLDCGLVRKDRTINT